MSTLPQYEERCALVKAYGWNLLAWPAFHRATDNTTVLIGRWEDARGNVVPEPPSMPIISREGYRKFVLIDGQPHEVFLHLPVTATIAEWRDLLFDDYAARVPASQPTEDLSPCP